MITKRPKIQRSFSNFFGATPLHFLISFLLTLQDGVIAGDSPSKRKPSTRTMITDAKSLSNKTGRCIKTIQGLGGISDNKDEVASKGEKRKSGSSSFELNLHEQGKLIGPQLSEWYEKARGGDERVKSLRFVFIVYLNKSKILNLAKYYSRLDPISVKSLTGDIARVETDLSVNKAFELVRDPAVNLIKIKTPFDLSRSERRKLDPRLRAQYAKLQRNDDLEAANSQILVTILVDAKKRRSQEHEFDDRSNPMRRFFDGYARGGYRYDPTNSNRWILHVKAPIRALYQVVKDPAVVGINLKND